MLARRTTTALVGLTVLTNAFQQLPRPALRISTRRPAADDEDDFDFEAASEAVHKSNRHCYYPGLYAIDATHRSIGHRFKARVEEVQQLDVVEAVFGDEGPPLDLEKV